MKHKYQPGTKIYRLTLITFQDNKWFCHCDCGNTTKVLTNSLSTGNTKSCGCLSVEVSTAKSDQLIESRRQYEPRIASARRLWSYLKYTQNCLLSFEEFYQLSQLPCSKCQALPNREFNHFSTKHINASTKAINLGTFLFNKLIKINKKESFSIQNITCICKDCK